MQIPMRYICTGYLQRPTEKRMKRQEKDYGSQYWLRLAVNQAREIIDRELALAAEITSEPFDWVSPLAPDNREYQDQDFIDRLRIDLPKVPPIRLLAEGWPCLGRSRSHGERDGFFG